VLHGHGLNKTNALILGSLPKSIGRLAGFAGRSGGAWTAVRMTELVDLRHSAFRALMQETDQVVALCQWSKDLLIRNGVPADRISLSRHGLPESDESVEIDSAPLMLSANPLRVVFLGRLDRTKGPDTLIRAVRSLSDLAIELHLYGITQSDADSQYLNELKQLAGDDTRIRFLPRVDAKQVVSLLRKYHLLAVPSRGLETGPLVVLEAFAAGTPVIGSNLGGIAELINHEVNGMLVETDSIAAWRQAIQRCNEDRAMLKLLQDGIHPPRSMNVVADEMQDLYESLLQNGTAYQPANSLTEKIHAHR
jgi:glycosyltransferase involved in cell wall biosynthesis